MTTIEFLQRLIRTNETNTRHAQERHLFAALRAVELAEQIGAMFGENKEVREDEK